MGSWAELETTTQTFRLLLPYFLQGEVRNFASMFDLSSVTLKRCKRCARSLISCQNLI